MKKRKLLFLLPFMVFGALLCVSASTPTKYVETSHIALAATPNEDITYSYEDDQTSYVFTLKEENVAFITFVNKQTGAEGQMDGTYLLEDKILTIKVNDEEMFKFEITAEGTLKLIKDESWKEKFMELWNEITTFFTPLITGVSVTTIISTVVTITFAILNRKNNIKSHNNVLESTSLSLDMTKKCNEVLTELQETKEITEDASKQVKDSTRTLIRKVEEVYSLEKPIYTCIDILKEDTKMLSLMAANTKELVTCGAASQMKDIEMKVERM